MKFQKEQIAFRTQEKAKIQRYNEPTHTHTVGKENAKNMHKYR